LVSAWSLSSLHGVRQHPANGAPIAVRKDAEEAIMQFWTTIGLILVLSAVGLTYEIAAGRVLAPFFGTSLATWTAVIATVLAGFSLGSALGGLSVERGRRAAIRTVRTALVATAVLMALSPTALALFYALGARGTGGMLLSVFLAFFPASVLVIMPTPYLAKLAVEARPGREGSSLGLVLAAGSTGAIVGAMPSLRRGRR
jgi:spermidine synthase